MSTPRIVSLLPSATEIVCALGLEQALVGISHECDYPASITDRPRLTAPKIDIHANSHRIDQEVRTLVSKGLSIYTIDTEQLRSLQPELIITQDQCEVCAVPYRDVVDATQQVLGSPVAVLSLHPAMLHDIWSDTPDHRCGFTAGGIGCRVEVGLHAGCDGAGDVRDSEGSDTLRPLHCRPHSLHAWQRDDRGQLLR